MSGIITGMEKIDTDKQLYSTDDVADGAMTVKQKDMLEKPKEIGGRAGTDPTRYGDYEVNGKCVDF